MRSRLLALGAALGCGASAFACTIPVFRFALDRWEADKFRLVIPAAWLTQPDKVRLMIPLRGNGGANVRIEESADPSAMEAKLQFPHHDTALWSGKLDASTLPTLLDSPARGELLKHILSGYSVVWVVCTKEGEAAEADRVEKRLRFLEKVAALPVQDPDDPDSQLGPGPPLKLKFTVLRLSLDDPAEKLFAAMLAGPQQQDWIANRTPFAAPVFGKGRVLGAWALEELDDTAIEDATLFLIGRCSCRIKIQNPGWDLVLKTDWDTALAKAGESASEAGASPQDPGGLVWTNPSIRQPSAAQPATQRGTAPVNEAAVAGAPDPKGASVVVITASSPARSFLSSIPWTTIGAIILPAIVSIAALMLWFKR